MDEKDGSLDQIFAFAAAHHFLAHDKTLKEISRVLRPGGKAFYFYEPVTPKFFYRLAHWRVNRKRPHVPEDVLITSRLQELAFKNGLDMQIDYYPSTTKRGVFETFYFYLLLKRDTLFIDKSSSPLHSLNHEQHNHPRRPFSPSS
jgi:SAM-dependent methyltransferase